MSQDVTIKLNGSEVKVPQGTTIREAAEQNGISIPTFCYDERLKPYTSCFLCVVEVEGRKNFVPACGTQVAEGMSILTNSERVEKTRKMSLDLVLSDHAGDCVAPCETTCPSNVDIQGYIAHIANGQYEAATKLIKERNPLPVVCGRICPHPCEAQCRRALVDEPVAINPLKRFASEYELDNGPYMPPCAEDTGKKVAIVGGGPAGLSAAYYLRQAGHAVELHDMMPKLGGMTRYGIPSFRLPWDKLDNEINSIIDLGVDVHLESKLGRDFTIEQLKADGADAVLLAIGAFKSKKMWVDNEDLPGVVGGVDFLGDVVLGKHERKGNTACVIGGGDTAMDCCRVALRAGYKVTLLYRRTQEEMPAADYEQHETLEEGVEFRFLTAPVSVIEKDGKAAGMRVVTMELGEPDAGGRRRPVPIEGSEEDLPFDLIISAIGQDPDITCVENEKEKPETTKWNTFVYDQKTMATSVPGVFTAGDCAWGPETVIRAVSEGKQAAKAINLFFEGAEVKLTKPYQISRGKLEDLDMADYSPRYEHKKRAKETLFPPEQRLANGGYTPINMGLDEATALAESSRCIECGCNARFSCDLRDYATEYGATETIFAGQNRAYDEDKRHPLIKIEADKCITCGSCVRVCNELRDISALALENRGFFTKIVPSFNDSLQTAGCDACGMCHDVCPTGAMALNTGKFGGPWETDTTVTTCTSCSTGCALKVHTRDGLITKIESVVEDSTNGGVICRDGRFGFMLRDQITGKASLADAGELAKAKELFAAAGSVSCVVSANLTVEQIFAAKKVAQAKGGKLFYLAGEAKASSNKPFAKVEGKANLSLLKKLGATAYNGESADLLIALGVTVAKGSAKLIEINAFGNGGADAKIPLADALRTEGSFLNAQGELGFLTSAISQAGSENAHLAEVTGLAGLSLAELRQGLAQEVTELAGALSQVNLRKAATSLSADLADVAQDGRAAGLAGYMESIGL